MKKPLKSWTAPLAALALVLVVVPATALAWNHDASFETHIHGHAFSRVALESSDCKVKVRIFFDAPEAAYKNEARNYYRFHARIKLDDGHAILTRVFSNSAPGAREYSYVDDTQPDGCFAKAERTIRGIDVEGCRGAGCTPDPFK